MSQYKMTFASGYDITFKSLPAEDCDRYYNAIINGDNPFLEEFIFNTITDNKYVQDGEIDLPAGIVPTVVYSSFKLSGILIKKTDYVDFIDEARKNISTNPYMYIYAKVIQIMPSYTLDRLRSLTLNELLELFAFAEKVAGAQFLDTKKTRESIVSEETSKSSKTVKKGIGAFTKEELDSLKSRLQSQEEMLM